MLPEKEKIQKQMTQKKSFFFKKKEKKKREEKTSKMSYNLNTFSLN